MIVKPLAMIGPYMRRQPGAMNLRSHALRFIRFGIVGGVGAVVNTVVLYLLVHYGGWNHLVAGSVATEVAILSNFVMNDRWTFRDTGTTCLWVSRALRYHAIALAGALISLGILAALTMTVDMHYLVANLLGIGAGTVWNYTLNSRLTWAVTHIGVSPNHAPSVAYGTQHLAGSTTHKP